MVRRIAKGDGEGGDSVEKVVAEEGNRKRILFFFCSRVRVFVRGGGCGGRSVG